MVLGRYFATTFCADHRDRRNFHPRVFSQLRCSGSRPLLARLSSDSHQRSHRDGAFRPDPEQHLNLGRELSSVAAKLRYRVSKHSGLQTSEAEGRVGSPVDRDSQARPEEPERLGGAVRIEVARAERRTLTPDRQQHEI